MSTTEKLLLIYAAGVVVVFIYCMIDSPKDEPTMLIRIMACASVALAWPAVALAATAQTAFDALRGKK